MTLIRHRGCPNAFAKHAATFRCASLYAQVANNSSSTVNCDPEREKIERVYFEGTRPLFSEAVDNIGKMFEALERQYEPETVIKDYENAHVFLFDILACLKPELAQ